MFLGELRMEYTGKYKEMAEVFRKDECDEYTVEKFIRREMEADEFTKGQGTTNFEALKKWKTMPQNERDRWLNNAFCFDFGVGSFRDGYNIRQDKYGIVIEGNCAKCGGKITVVCD